MLLEDEVYGKMPLLSLLSVLPCVFVSSVPCPLIYLVLSLLGSLFLCLLGSLFLCFGRHVLNVPSVRFEISCFE